jgi:hypothetical protein
VGGWAGVGREVRKRSCKLTFEVLDNTFTGLPRVVALDIETDAAIVGC